MESLTIEDFKPLTGTKFHIAAPERDVELVLERVAAVMESERARLPRQPFSLYFLGPGDRMLPQMIYEMRHDAFRELLPMFIVPIGRTKDGFQYEAVFT